MSGDPDRVEAEGFALAEQFFADGFEALEQGDCVEAADLLAQCLEFHAQKSGDTSAEAAVVAVKYGQALLACSRMKGTNLLGTLKKTDPFAAGTSKDAEAAAQAPEAPEEDMGGEEDLELAWEVAETARIGLESNKGHEQVTAEALTEAYQLLGDIGAERELFPEAVADYEKALATVTTLEEADERWEAELHFKCSVALELADRGPEAAEQIQAAIKLISRLIKEKQADLKELQKAKASDASAAKEAKPAAAGEAAVQDASAAPEATERPAEKEAGATAEPAATEAADTDAQDGELKAADAEEGQAENEEDEIGALESELKELQSVLSELKERSNDLASQKEQEAAIKEQLKAALGLGPLPSNGGASTSSAAAAGSGSAQPQDLRTGPGGGEENASGSGAATDGVQDLGVIKGKRKREEKEDDKGEKEKEKKAPLLEKN